jgi:hypothetical protein
MHNERWGGSGERLNMQWMENRKIIKHFSRSARDQATIIAQ